MYIRAFDCGNRNHISVHVYNDISFYAYTLDKSCKGYLTNTVTTSQMHSSQSIVIYPASAINKST